MVLFWNTEQCFSVNAWYAFVWPTTLLQSCYITIVQDLFHSSAERHLEPHAFELENILNYDCPTMRIYIFMMQTFYNINSFKSL